MEWRKFMGQQKIVIAYTTALIIILCSSLQLNKYAMIVTVLTKLQSRDIIVIRFMIKNFRLSKRKHV